ncbi:methyltransferase domain-containing protein [Actinokineospora sp. PR83]|uniref:methyltransferase n=1 Tax=Actinokineospora sp. PR83 TaxID=2884908 RepID=UPI001F478C7A|nr:methyltransferase [Actinokineospora sp. PR83]MCG8917251.1 methyltransferase domain-containing protein [Actinokineospora sp. PR83]
MNKISSREDLVGPLFGAAAFQMLRAGVELGLFGLLQDKGELPAADIGPALGLSERSTRILLLGVTALGLTEVTEDGSHRNAPVLAEMFADGSWDIFADIVAFEAELVYLPLSDLVESLRSDTNAGLARFAGEGDDLYHRLPETPHLEALFYRSMRSWSRLSNPVLVAKADLTGVSRVLDVGGGDGVNAIALARANPGVRFTVVDLPGAVEIARGKIAEAGLADRIDVAPLDIFHDEYPAGHDAVLFANQLVIWSAEQNLDLLRRAHAALPDGGRVMVFNVMSDDSGDGPLYSALDNAYFATLTAPRSMIYPWGDYEGWLREAGFAEVHRAPGDTWTPHGVISGIKGGA